MKFCTLSGVKIGGVAACVPRDRVDNGTAGAELFGSRLADTIRVTGIRERRVAPPGVTSLDLSVAAGKRLLDAAALDPATVGGVIFVTQTPDHDMPNNSSRAAHLLGLPKDCSAVDTSFGYSG